MKYIIRTSVLTLLLLFIAIFSLIAQTAIFPKGKLAPNVHHRGDVWLSHLSKADKWFDYNIVIATFASGAKLNWHKHPKGQQLLILEGIGYYQERGKPLQIVSKGDVVKCLPDVEHWHASTPNTSVTYLAITGNEKTQWLESVDDHLYKNVKIDTQKNKIAQKQVIELSKKKWLWMSEKNIDALQALYHEKATFVHMGGAWEKERELAIIKKGNIRYKKIDVHAVSINILGDTAILYNRITMWAVVPGREVSIPFLVTEVYKQAHDNWKLASLSFTKLTKKSLEDDYGQ